MASPHAKLEALIRRVGSDANAASELLAIAAELFENGEPLPAPLAAFLADVFRRTVAEPSANRSYTVALELGLSAPAKEGAPAKFVDYHAIVAIIEHEFATNGGISETKLKSIIAEQSGVSENTALKHIKPAIMVPKLLKDNGLKSLVRSRERPKPE